MGTIINIGLLSKSQIMVMENKNEIQSIENGIKPIELVSSNMN